MESAKKNWILKNKTKQIIIKNHYQTPNSVINAQQSVGTMQCSAITTTQRVQSTIRLHIEPIHTRVNRPNQRQQIHYRTMLLSVPTHITPKWYNADIMKLASFCSWIKRGSASFACKLDHTLMVMSAPLVHTCPLSTMYTILVTFFECALIMIRI